MTTKQRLMERIERLEAECERDIVELSQRITRLECPHTAWRYTDLTKAPDDVNWLGEVGVAVCESCRKRIPFFDHVAFLQSKEEYYARMHAKATEELNAATRNTQAQRVATRVAFTAYGATHATEFNYSDVTLDDLIVVMRGILISAGFNETQVCAQLRLWDDATAQCDAQCDAQ